MALIEPGKGVMLKRGKNLRYICASDQMEKLDPKFAFDCSCMLGKKYGTAFQISEDRDHKLRVIDPVLVEEHAEEYLKIQIQDGGDGEKKDNRNIEDVADQQNQKLSKDDIMSLQDEGVCGESIIRELVENSATFNARTEFSKAKYLKKKKKKYVPQFLALAPNARLLCEMYFFKNPLKILDLRPDTVAQMLTWSDIQAGSNVVLFESCQGLIAGALMERLGSTGRLIQLYKSSFPVRIIMEQFNFSSAELEKNLCSMQIDKVEILESLFQSGKSDQDILEMMLGQNIFETNTDIGVESKNGVKEEMEVCNDSVLETNGNTQNAVNIKKKEDEAPGENKRDKYANNRKRKYGKNKDEENESHKMNFNRVAYVSKEQRLKESQVALNHFRSKQIDSLIIASKFHPKAPLLALLKFLPPSGSFVVYFPHKEPLMECYVLLRELNLAANIELTESWFRNIQVLPNRTHPENVMSGSGGFILRGMKVE